jgi:hypothetical protein
MLEVSNFATLRVILSFWITVDFCINCYFVNYKKYSKRDILRKAPHKKFIVVFRDIMGRRQGSAVDAAIATILCQCVENGRSCGIGGGHFMTVYKR